jgi:flagellar FliL protein
MTEVNEVNFSKGGKMAEGEGGKGLGRFIRPIVIGVVAIVLLGGGGFAAWWFLLHKAPEEKAHTAGGAREGARGGESAGELIEHPQYLDLGSFTVNLAEGRRFLKTSAQVLLNDEKAKDYLGTRLVEAKDLVVSELQMETSDSLKDPRERELMKQRILTKLQTLLPIPPKDWKDPMPIKKLLITEFLIQ